MKLIRSNLLFSTVLALLVCAGLAHAQETTTGTITGEVLDAQGSVMPGATVTILTGTGVKTMTTDTNGRFFAPFLTPGTYTVRVELAGFSPVEHKGVEVRLGQRLALNFALTVGQMSEAIEVVGSAPVVDVGSTTVGGVLDSESIKRLPVGRNFTDTLYLVPGVSDSSYAGKANPSIGGASGLENNYIIDGVNVSNAGFGALGSYSRQYGSLGTGVTSDFIKETQVKTGGFEAEFGQASGGVVNVVTQGGTNEFHGSLFGYFRPNSLESTRDELQTPNGTINIKGTDLMDFGLSLGGPLVKDKVFAFATFNPQFDTQTMVAPPAFPLESLGEVDRKRKTYSYAGKLTWQSSPNHRFDVSLYGDPSEGENGPQRNTALFADSDSRFSSIKFGGHNQALKYDGIMGPNWLVEMTVGHSSNKIEETPSSDTYSTTDTTVIPFGRSGGIGFYENDKGDNYQFSLKSTNLFNAGGQHQVRYGFQYENIDYFQGTRRTGAPITLSNGQVTSSGATRTILPDPVYGRIYRVSRADLSPGRDTNQKYMSFFLQDTWSVGKRLTLRPGVRYDRQQLTGSKDFPACFANTPRVGETGTGEQVACQYTFDNNWGPRLGATFDVRGDGKSKIFASVGRFYVKIPNDMAARALAADAGVTRADYFDEGFTQPVPQGVLAAGSTNHLTLAGLHPAVFDADVKSTYSDEFVGGFEIEAARGLNIGVRYVNRNIPRVMEDVAPASVLLYSLAGSIEYFITNVTAETETFNSEDYGVDYPKARFEDPSHRYQAIEVTANKSFSNNWALIASYRWAKLSGNYEGFFRSDNGQSDPGITSLFDFPTNDPSYSQIGVPQFGFRGDIRYQGTTLGEGRLPNDRPHQLKLYSNYTFGNLNTGIGINVGSGRSLTALAANPAYTNSGEIPESLRGEGFETRDGFKKLTDTEFYVDAHLDYTFRMNDSQRVVLLADVFNVLNDQQPLDYDNYTETTFATPNPDFGSPKAGGGAFSQYHAPRQLRIGARFEW